MTIKELRKLLRGMPPNMTVVIGAGESLEDICHTASQPLMVKLNDSDEKQMLFVLAECTCHFDEVEDGQPNCKPELN